MNDVFNELQFCKFDDDCEFITLDDDSTLKGFTSKPKYFEVIGKWLLDTAGETFVYGTNLGIDTEKLMIKILERASHTDNFGIKNIIHPRDGVNNDIIKPLRISKTKNLVRRTYSIQYYFDNTYMIKLGDGDFIRVINTMCVDIDDSGVYYFSIPENEKDRVIRVLFSNDDHRQYIKDTYNYIFEGTTDSFIIIGSEYEDIYNTVSKTFELSKLKKIVDKVIKDYV